MQFEQQPEQIGLGLNQRIGDFEDIEQHEIRSRAVAQRPRFLGAIAFKQPGEPAGRQRPNHRQRQIGEPLGQRQPMANTGLGDIPGQVLQRFAREMHQHRRAIGAGAGIPARPKSGFVLQPKRHFVLEAQHAETALRENGEVGFIEQQFVRVMGDLQASRLRM